MIHHAGRGRIYYELVFKIPSAHNTYNYQSCKQHAL